VRPWFARRVAAATWGGVAASIVANGEGAGGKGVLRSVCRGMGSSGVVDPEECLVGTDDFSRDLASEGAGQSCSRGCGVEREPQPDRAVVASRSEERTRESERENPSR
jgi:hypothetical protein